MVPLGSKALIGMGLVTLVVSVLYGLETNESSATTILGFVAIGALVLGVVVLLADPDRAPWYAPDTPLGQQAPSGTRPSLPSVWPLAAGLALGLFVVAAATNAILVVCAIVLAVVVGIGWLLQEFSEHPSVSGSYASRLINRVVLPIRLPLGVFVLVAIIAASLSRVFLALPEDGTRIVALVIAVVILISAFAVAASERMARTALALLCAFAFICVLGAGAAGLAHGERTFEKSTKPIAHGKLLPGLNPGVVASLYGPTTTSIAGSSTTTTAAG